VGGPSILLSFTISFCSPYKEQIGLNYANIMEILHPKVLRKPHHQINLPENNLPDPLQPAGNSLSITFVKVL
jgi:hypothetical protein